MRLFLQTENEGPRSLNGAESVGPQISQSEPHTEVPEALLVPDSTARASWRQLYEATPRGRSCSLGVRRPQGLPDGWCQPLNGLLPPQFWTRPDRRSSAPCGSSTCAQGTASSSSSRSRTRPASSTWTASTSSSCASRTGEGWDTPCLAQGRLCLSLSDLQVKAEVQGAELNSALGSSNSHQLPPQSFLHGRGVDMHPRPRGVGSLPSCLNCPH